MGWFENVLHGLHHLPNFWIWVVIAGLNLSLFLLLPLLVRRFYNVELNADVVKGADDAFKTLVALTMALSAFALVQVEGIHRNVSDLAAREGAILLKFDRSLADFSVDDATAVREGLRGYLSSLVKSEWPGLATGERSAETSARLADLSARVEHLNVTEPKQLVSLGEAKGQLAQIKDVREARLASSHMNLSPYFWFGILAALGILAVLGWFQAPVEKMVPYLGGLMLGLSTLLSIVVISSGVFEGESRVTAEPIERTLALIPPAAAPAAPAAAH